MRREMKFRVFDKAFSMMIYRHLQKYDNDHPEIEVMQFIGIKDINGVDIYEGDIVSHAKESVFSSKWTMIGKDVVKWDKHEACFKIGGESMIFKGYKILGNIHENIGLLK